MSSGVADLTDEDIALLTPEERLLFAAAIAQRQTYESLNLEERRRVSERIELENDLAKFARAAWPILEPGVELDWSWHYELFCEYLTLVYQRILRRLIINLPPRTAKSLFVSVIFPAWVWAKQNTHNFACGSYAEKLAIEHSVKRRVLIESEWYQSRWGSSVKMAPGQNEKSKFKNTAMAQMIATSVGGTAIGLGGDTLILDDGMNPKQVASDAETLTAHNWFDDTWRTRLNDLSTGAFIIIEQRTGQRDITGHCLEADEILKKAGKQPEWTHLSIPLECENVPERYKFPISGRVHVREVGDILQPKRFPPEVVTSLQSPAGVRNAVPATAFAARRQHDQAVGDPLLWRTRPDHTGTRYGIAGEVRPQPRLGRLLIQRPEDERHGRHRRHLGQRDRTATCGMSATRISTFRRLRRKSYQQKEYKASTVLVEDKANGSAVIKSIRRKISGVVAVDPRAARTRGCSRRAESSKRATGGSRETHHGRRGVHQLTAFPGAKYDDIADLITQADGLFAAQHLCVWLHRVHSAARGGRHGKKTAKIKKAIPANATPEEKAAIEDANGPTKIAVDTDDTTERCPACGGTFIQNLGGAKGKRCGACGSQWSQTKPHMPATTDFGFSK